MGSAAVIGDVCTCFRKHHEMFATQGVLQGSRDLDDAVLAAMNQSLDADGGLTSTIRLSFRCENLPNYDTVTRSDGMAVLYKQA
jgi:hypothetical protein